jgi:hypothetical protein
VADDADDATAAATADDDAVLPRSMPSIEEADGGKGDDDDAPIALLLARFIQNFRLRIDGPVVVAIVVVRRRGPGDMNWKSPGGF